MPREFQVYQGAEPTAPQVHVQQMPSFGGLPHNGEAVDRALAGLERAAEGWARISDLGTAQRVEAERNRNRDEMETELQTAANADWSSDDALFRSDGTLNQDTYDRIVGKYREKNEEIQASFLLRDNATRHAVAASEEQENINVRAAKFVALKQIANTRDVFQDNYRLALEQGRYGDAAHYAREAGASGVLTPAQVQRLEYEAGQKGAADELDALTYSNPDEAYDRLNNGQYDMYLSPAERARRLAKMREDKKLAKPKDIMDTYIDNPEAAKAKDKTPEFSGYFTAQECGWINAIAAGKGGDVKQEMEYAAIEEARAFDPKGDPERFRADFMRKWNGQFGLDKDFCTRQLSVVEKRRGKLTSPQIDVKQRLDNMESGGVLRNEATWKKIQENMPSVEKIRRDYKALAGINADDSDDRVKEKYLTYRDKAHNKELRGRINEMYDAWLDTEEGEKAAPVVQAEKFLSIARQVTGRKDIGMGERMALNMMYTTGMQAQGVRHREWEREQGQRFHIEPRAAQEPYMNASIGFDSERKDLPAGVLLPKSMLGNAKQEDVVMEITYDNKHIRRFRVVGTTDGEQPVMTYAVARDGGYELDRVYNVAARLRHGRTDELMAPMDKPIGGSSVQGSLGITRDTPPPASADKLGGLAPYRDAFIAAGNKYGIDPNFLMAIAMHETGKGTSSAFRNKNNAMGVSGSGGPRSFGSVEESIDYMAGQLKKNYFDKGLTTIERIGNKYAPVGAANDPKNLNGYWTGGVSRYYGELRK